MYSLQQLRMDKLQDNFVQDCTICHSTCITVHTLHFRANYNMTHSMLQTDVPDLKFHIDQSWHILGENLELVTCLPFLLFALLDFLLEWLD